MPHTMKKVIICLIIGTLMSAFSASWVIDSQNQIEVEAKSVMWEPITGEPAEQLKEEIVTKIEPLIGEDPEPVNDPDIPDEVEDTRSTAKFFAMNNSRCEEFSSRSRVSLAWN